MSTTSYKQLDIKDQEELKRKFMEGASISELANEYNLIRQSLGWYVRKHNWDEQRRLQRAEIFQAFSDNKKAAFTSIYIDGVSLLKKTVKDALREYDKVKDIKDRLRIAKQISEVIKELDKIQRLDEGKPTDIVEEKPFSVEDLKKRLSSDPFFEEVPTVEFKEISSISESSSGSSNRSSSSKKD